MPCPLQKRGEEQEEHKEGHIGLSSYTPPNGHTYPYTHISNVLTQVVSKMGKGNKTAGQILSELGPMGVWGGLGTRIIMIGTLTGLQWWIYDSFKTAFGLGTSGPAVKK